MIKAVDFKAGLLVSHRKQCLRDDKPNRLGRVCTVFDSPNVNVDANTRHMLTGRRLAQILSRPTGQDHAGGFVRARRPAADMVRLALYHDYHLIR
jgi:hypothetical protein